MEDDNSDFEFMSSQPDKKMYESAPQDTKFKFKLLFKDSEKPRKIGYLLKAGIPLPYVASNVGGKLVLMKYSNIFK